MNDRAIPWQLTLDWRFEADLVTELDVRFAPEGSSSRRVDLEHRGLEAFGDQADIVRGIFDGPGGWADLLARYQSSPV